MRKYREKQLLKVRKIHLTKLLLQKNVPTDIFYFGTKNYPTEHCVWKPQKKSYSTLRAKRATFTFWVDKGWLKMPKMVHFGEFLKPEACGQTVLRLERQVSFNRSKIGGKCQNSKYSNATLWVIFIQCVTES